MIFFPPSKLDQLDDTNSLRGIIRRNSWAIAGHFLFLLFATLVSIAISFLSSEVLIVFIMTGVQFMYPAFYESGVITIVDACMQFVLLMLCEFIAIASSLVPLGLQRTPHLLLFLHGE